MGGWWCAGCPPHASIDRTTTSDRCDDCLLLTHASTTPKCHANHQHRMATGPGLFTVVCNGLKPTMLLRVARQGAWRFHVEWIDRSIDRGVLLYARPYVCTSDGGAAAAVGCGLRMCGGGEAKAGQRALTSLLGGRPVAWCCVSNALPKCMMRWLAVGAVAACAGCWTGGLSLRTSRSFYTHTNEPTKDEIEHL